ncbi:MAG: DNA repair protein RecO [Acidobacteriota bacterium]
MYKRSEAIILKTHKLGELDKIVTAFTRGEGKLRGVAKGARKLKQRFGPAFEPMTHVNLNYFEKPGSELVRIDAAELLESFFPRDARADVLAALSCMAELMDGFAQEKQANDALFRLALTSARSVSTTIPRIALVYFEAWLLRLSGFLPSISRCARCGAAVSDSEPMHAEPDLGGLRCDRCSERRVATLAPADRSFLASAFHTPPADIASNESLQAAADSTHTYLRKVIEHALGHRVRTYALLDL